MCLVLLLGSSSLAQVLHVPGDHTSIQAGIDSAEPGDTILVAEGIYFENIDFRGKALTLASYFLIDSDTAHISRTIINGSRAQDLTRASVVSLRSGEDSTSVLCGFTITGGTGSYLTDVHTESDMKSWRNMCGGGVVMHRSGGKIIHNLIEYNHLQTDTIRGSYGGGILANVNGGRTAIIRSNIIRLNTMRKRHGHGAGICLLGGRILLEHNVIMDNSIDAKFLAVGGGIFYQNDSTEGGAREVAIRNNVIALNRISSQDDLGMGGGIGLCYGLEDTIMEIHHNIIAENYADGIGAGLYSYSGQGMVYGNLIFDNSAEMYGDPIALEGRQGLALDYNHLWSGPVWLITRGSLSKVYLNKDFTEAMITYLKHEDPEVTSLFSINPSSGELWIGERKGMLSFNPFSVPLQSFAPPMIIVDFRQPELAHTEAQDLQLKLSHNENFLKFKFSVLEPPIKGINPDDKVFGIKYFMEDIDQDTAMTGMEQTADYRNLKPGRYNFWAASPKFPVWDPNVESVSLKLRVYPPWYRSALALGLYVVFLVILIIGITASRTSRLRKEKEHLEREVTRRTKDLNEKNARIIEMERLKTNFFTDISHEIRTPLSLISGPLDQLINQEYRDPRIVRWLSMIRRNSQNLNQLIDQLLDISRLDAGHMNLVFEESDLNAHVRLLAGQFFSLAESQEIRYLIDIPDENLITHYDREKLEKVCTNLLSNAFKFTPSGGTVTCRLRVLGNASPGMDPRIQLMVADTGPGIPANLQDKIFDRFYRGEFASSHDTDGTGIGLSLTRELVNLMHGEIVVKSKVGSGTVFLVTFPAGCEHLKQEEYILKESENQLEGKSLPEGGIIGSEEERMKSSHVSLLVVEDNRDLQEFLLENLSTEFKVRGAYDGQQGITLARSDLPDLVITDVMMPGEMDGHDVCKDLKSDERTSHIPVIMLTAKTTSKDKIEGLELGADDYIIKPFSMDELLVRIRNLLKQREDLRKKYSSMIGVDWDKISITTMDEQFLKNVLGNISENLTDFNFNVGRLQEMMFMSREHIFRKLKALTGESPSSLIRIMRLKAAASMMENGAESITSISMQVGFSNPSYFSQCFKAYFGQSPSDYLLRKPANYTP
jgi:signal transduction histidine kinase/DNA-binding response OmpR family regulator